MNNSKSITSVSSNQAVTLSTIQKCIIELPGRPQAMLARDLAVIYETESRVINQAVNRNPERFPSDFYFQATDEETKILTSQSVILKHFTHNPFLFTREGANMLSVDLMM